jgi:hypothetical protein
MIGATEYRLRTFKEKSWEELNLFQKFSLRSSGDRVAGGFMDKAQLEQISLSILVLPRLT